MGVFAPEDFVSDHDRGRGRERDVCGVHAVRTAICLRLDDDEQDGQAAMIFTMRWAMLLLLSLDGTQAPQELAISVNVDLVMLHATVRDRNGVAAGELAATDFAVYENGVRQSIRVFQHQDQPVTAGLVVDHSGSMRSRLADVVEAARAFVRFSSAEDEMFVVNFNENVSLGLGRPGVLRTGRTR